MHTMISYPRLNPPVLFFSIMQSDFPIICEAIKTNNDEMVQTYEFLINELCGIQSM